MDRIREKNLEARGVFLTHTHFDHIYGLNALVETYPDIVVYVSENGRQGLYSDKLNMSRYGGAPFVYKYGNTVTLKNHDEIPLCDNHTLVVYETPGHDWSCLCFLCDGYLFTGDSYLPRYGVVAGFPKSDKAQARLSLRAIRQLLTERAKACCPGHGEIVGIG